MTLPLVETRAMPQHEERRNQLLDKMEQMTEAAKKENRSFKQSELSLFDEYKSEIASIDRKRQAEQRGLNLVPMKSAMREILSKSKRKSGHL